MKQVAIFGGSGFIGGELARALAERGDRVAVVSRRPRAGGESGGAFHHYTWRQLEAVLPKRMTAFGYAFRFRTIDEAVRDLLQKR